MPVAYDNDFGGHFTVRGREFIDAGLISSQIKKVLKEHGVPEEAVRRAAVVAFEAEVNIISYADMGTISFRVENETITIEAVDKGAGIPDIKSALIEGFSTADDQVREMGFGAGMGLPNIRKFSDVFEINSEIGRGTTVRSIINITKKDGL
jgi:serine/threonine-protein kinase RsbT